MTRIALIEDCVPDAVWFSITLSQMHLSPAVQVYHTGVEAIQAFRKEQPPDLIISDWFLPMLDFPELLQEVRTIPGYEKVPVAAFVLQQSSLISKAGELGVFRCLTKPIDEDQVRGLMAEIETAHSDHRPI